MTNLVAFPSTSQAPPAQTREQRALLSNYLNAIEKIEAGHYSISDRRAPTEVDLNRLHDRLDSLRAAIGTSDPKRVAERVIRLFLRFPSTAQMAGSQVEQMVAAYATDLCSFPLWAIDAACIAVTKGDSQFPPSAPTLRTKVEAQIAVVRHEAAEIEKVLGAAVYREPAPDERERVTKGFEDLLADLQWNRPAEKRSGSHWPLTKDEAEAKLAILMANPEPVPQLSPEARAAFTRKEDAA